MESGRLLRSNTHSTLIFKWNRRYTEDLSRNSARLPSHVNVFWSLLKSYPLDFLWWFLSLSATSVLILTNTLSHLCTHSTAQPQLTPAAHFFFYRPLLPMIHVFVIKGLRPRCRMRGNEMIMETNRADTCDRDHPVAETSVWRCNVARTRCMTMWA